ncbi:MAG TPA: Gfo/Idh/MocA family oxidoreductase [Acidimicrobiales bacterium]|nr:Gfo/Idh/MocA family oxidoreductase [Acidimicrobiales bacterium]
MEGLRTAVAGTGFIGRVHCRSARLAGARLVGVSASTLASAEAAASELWADRAFASSEELVEADDVDVVHICTPNHLHEPLALKALAAGKHVVCEKPVAFDGEGAARIAAAAAAAGRVVAVPFVYRFHPTAREARARVAAGELGLLRLLHGSYQQDWLLGADDVNWRVDAALGGPSRAFADIGSHWCDLVEFVSGSRITRLLARTVTTVPERAAAPGGATFSTGGGTSERRPVDTEDAVVLLFETDRGGVGSLVVSQVSAGRKNRLWFELDGERAAVVFDQEQPESLWVGHRDRAEVVDRDPAHLAPDAARLATLPAGHGQGYHDCFDLFVADAYAAIRGDRLPEGLPLIDDGVRAARLTDAVLASARSQNWTEVITS